MSAASDPMELAVAVWDGDLPAVETLIAAGVDVNAIPEGRFSPPLHDAIEQLHVEIARRLIAAGADVNHDVGLGQTPLFHAIDSESDRASQRGLPPNEASTELTELLLAAGAIPTERAFELARVYNNCRVLALLEHASHAAPGTSSGGEAAFEDDFDRALARSGDKLARLATEALAEHRTGLTKELAPGQL